MSLPGRKRGVTGALEVVNMAIDLAATDFALAIAHDLCDQSYVLFLYLPTTPTFTVAGRS